MRLPLLLTGLLAGLAIALPAPGPPAKTSYDGTKVLRVPLPQSKEAANKLKATIDLLKLPLWTENIAPGHAVDFEVPKDKLSAFKKAIGSTPFEVMHEDLGESIRKESEGSEQSFKLAAAGATGGSVSAQAVDMTWFNSYHAYADHLSYLNQLVAQYPSRAEVITAGTSEQGRAITGIHIWGSGGKGSKPAVIWHGTVHAREWITAMTVEFITYTLLSNYDNSTEVKSLVDSYDYYIFPVVNPDGFVFSQTTTRLWRKNRQQQSSCYGTDINRNWDAFWSVSGGASTNPCAETYKGPNPGSAPEYQGLSAFQNALAAKPQGVKQYIDFHSYSQLLMYPYGYSCSTVTPDNTELGNIARGAVAEIRAVYGKSFQYGPVCNTIYQTTGSSVDYSYSVTKIKYTYTFELRDTGSYGFVLPPDQIYPSGVETWAGVKYMLQNMR